MEYWLLGAQVAPREFELLETRGFGVRFCNQSTQRRREVNVIVLDLNNWQDDQGRKFAALPNPEREQQVRQQVDSVMGGVAGRSTVLVVYAAGRFDYLDEVGRDLLVAPTNNPVTLVGTVVDAAYLAAGNS